MSDQEEQSHPSQPSALEVLQAELGEAPEPSSENLMEEFQEYLRRRHDHDAAAFAARNAKASFKEQEARLWRLMESMEMKTFGTDHQGKVTRVNKVIAQVINEHAVVEYLQDLGLLNSFRIWQLSKAKLNAHLKEKLNETGEIPPGLDAYTPLELRYTKPKEEAVPQEVEITD